MKTTAQGTVKPQAAPQAMREGESLLQTLAEYAPVVVWVMDANGSVTYLSRYWQEFTGRESETDIGFKWVEAVHPEDCARAAAELMHANNSQQPSRGEYRVRRVDGEYAWLRDYSVPFFNADGSLAGRVGACMDITEQKVREKTAQKVQETLILGQEAERRRVARELHDDVGQRIALLGMALQDVERVVPAVSRELGEKLKSLRDDLETLAIDIHRISHNLHPSTVANLGLVPALRRLCAEFSEQTPVSVDFSSTDIQGDIPEAVALAIFRIAQACLTNVVKHSRGDRARVTLEEQSGNLRLTVADQGVGFDVNGLGTTGLGLISIQERARILGGTVDIASAPGQGTRIELRVPRP